MTIILRRLFVLHLKMQHKEDGLCCNNRRTVPTVSGLRNKLAEHVLSKIVHINLHALLVLLHISMNALIDIILAIQDILRA